MYYIHVQHTVDHNAEKPIRRAVLKGGKTIPNPAAQSIHPRKDAQFRPVRKVSGPINTFTLSS